MTMQGMVDCLVGWNKQQVCMKEKLDEWRMRGENDLVHQLVEKKVADNGRLPKYPDSMWKDMNEALTSEEMWLKENPHMKSEIVDYINNDIKNTKELINMVLGAPKLSIKKVIFNDPATIIFWTDGTKTTVKADNEPFDPEKGMAMAIAKKALGNKGNYFEVFKKHLPKEGKSDD